MTKDRKRKLNRIAERVAIGLVILDVVVYFAVVQRVRSMAQQKLEKARDQRLEVRNEEIRVNRLEWYKDSVPTTEKEISEFLGNEVQAKRKFFTRATRLLQALAEHSGVEIAGISYKSDSGHDEPLDRVNIIVTAKGPFRGLMSFAHGLETTSDEFFVIHDFGFDSPEAPIVALKLSADLYLTP